MTAEPDSWDQIASDTDAEEAVIGAVLSNGRLIDQVPDLMPEDFWRPFNGQIWEAMQALAKRGEAIDTLTVKAETEARGLWTKGHQATELFAYVEKAGILANVAWYAQRIKELAVRRNVIAATLKATQIARNPATPIEDAANLAERVIREAVPVNTNDTGLMTLDQFVDRDIEQASWVVRPLLRRGERLVLTGIEGLGKTTMMRQIGVATAAGLEPFTLKDAPPQRVLFVDCENPEEIMQRSFLQLRNVLKRRHKSTDDRFFLKRHPGGMDLSKPRERAMLRGYCREAKPDLLLIGPAYKLYVGGASQREEDLARIVVSALDELREEFNLALILEHHAPHQDQESARRGGARDVRPIGSSLWLRWPEFGWGIRPKKGGDMSKREVEVAHWRGQRDTGRPWPRTMISGGDGALPWVDPARM